MRVSIYKRVLAGVSGDPAWPHPEYEYKPLGEKKLSALPPEGSLLDGRKVIHFSADASDDRKVIKVEVDSERDAAKITVVEP